MPEMFLYIDQDCKKKRNILHFYIPFTFYSQPSSAFNTVGQHFHFYNSWLQYRFHHFSWFNQWEENEIGDRLVIRVSLSSCSILQTSWRYTNSSSRSSISLHLVETKKIWKNGVEVSKLIWQLSLYSYVIIEIEYHELFMDICMPRQIIQILFNSVNYGSQLFNVHSVLRTVLNPQVHLTFNGNCCFIWTISSTWVINLTNNTLKISENSNQSRKWKSITPFVCWLKNQTPTAAELPLCLRESSAQLQFEAPESWNLLQFFTLALFALRLCPTSSNLATLSHSAPPIQHWATQKWVPPVHHLGIPRLHLHKKWHEETTHRKMKAEN